MIFVHSLKFPVLNNLGFRSNEVSNGLSCRHTKAYIRPSMLEAKTIPNSQHEESNSKSLSENERANQLAERLKMVKKRFLKNFIIYLRRRFLTFVFGCSPHTKKQQI